MNWSKDKNEADPKDQNLDEKDNQPDSTTGGGLSQFERDKHADNDQPFDPAHPDFPDDDNKH